MRWIASGASLAVSGLAAGTFGWTALIAVMAPFVLLIGFAAWVVGDPDRTRRVQRLIRAWRGSRR